MKMAVLEIQQTILTLSMRKSTLINNGLNKILYTISNLIKEIYFYSTFITAGL